MMLTVDSSIYKISTLETQEKGINFLQIHFLSFMDTKQRHCWQQFQLCYYQA